MDKEAQRKANGVPEYPVVEKKPEITFDDFEKIQIQVGEVLKCEPVKKAKKLLCSQIRVGEEVRQIVSGISQYYKPEEMVGKKEKSRDIRIVFCAKGIYHGEKFAGGFWKFLASTGIFSEHAARRSCQDRGTCVPAGKTDRVNVYPGEKI